MIENEKAGQGERETCHTFTYSHFPTFYATFFQSNNTYEIKNT